MCKLLKWVSLPPVLLTASLFANADEGISTNSGIPLTKQEVESWSITIYPDGRNLPDGEGTAAKGEQLYQMQCMACHGMQGEKGVAPRLKGDLGYQEWGPHPLLALTVGAWPYSTTIFDYIRRAMPHQSPKTLSDPEVYALTAYILHLNGLIEKDTPLNREKLKSIDMPYKEKSFIAWDVEEGSKLQDKEPKR